MKYLETSSALVARGLAEDLGITVRFGSGPSFNTRTRELSLPRPVAFAQDAAASVDEVDRARAVGEIYLAMALHETGHAKWSSEAYSTDEVARWLENALDDVRIDAQSQRDYRGGRRIFEAGYGWLRRMGWWKPVDEGAASSNATMLWVLYAGRAKLAGQAVFADLAAQSERVLRDQLGDDVVDGAWQIIAKTSKASSVADVKCIVAELLAFLESCADASPPPPPEQGDSDPSGEDEPGSDDSDGSEDTSPSGQGDSDPSGEEEPGSGGAGTRELRDIRTMDVSALPTNVGEALQEAFADESARALDQGATYEDFPEVVHTSAQRQGTAGFNACRALGTRLARLLLARSRGPTSYDTRGSRIDRRMLPRIPLGEREVFVEEGKEIRVDTAILVLIDRSSSMISDDRIAVARDAALHACQAFEGIRSVAVGAAAFPEATGTSTEAVLELIPLGAPVAAHVARMKALDAPVWALTPLHAGLRYARYALGRRKEARKLCLVLTDGEPDSELLARSELDAMARIGIDVLGIGIQTMTVADLFPHHVVINDLGELERGLFQLLQDGMLRQAA